MIIIIFKEKRQEFCELKIVFSFNNYFKLKETLHNSKLDLGFRFVFPKGKDLQGKPLGRPFTVVKLKDKDILELLSSVTISPEHIKLFESMEKVSKAKFLGI